MDIKNPPVNLKAVISDELLVQVLKPLVGTPFKLSLAPRTDGSNLRKIITDHLKQYVTNANPNDYKIVPAKRKGVPRLLSVLVDTYIVTSGINYNLQVWNRSPNSVEPLVRYNNGDVITPRDIRLVLVKIDTIQNKIESIAVLTPSYIVSKFGLFGKPTIKSQLLISNNKRAQIVNSGGVLILSDTINVDRISQKSYIKPTVLSTEPPSINNIMSLDVIKNLLANKLIGLNLPGSDTKTRGQYLERIVIDMLGYNSKSTLVGGYPDIPNQLLEVKVQDTQTIDLGKYSPQFEEEVYSNPSLTTYDVRYLIALTNPYTLKIEGIVFSCGYKLGSMFTYVSAESYKCQRTIPMKFFDTYKNDCVFNP